MTYKIINIDLSTPRINEVYNLAGNSIKVIDATSDCFIQFDDTTQDPINLMLVDEIKIKFTKFYLSNVAIENKYIKIIVSENFNLDDRISISDYIPENIPENIPEPTPIFMPVQIINITNPEANVPIELNLNRLNFNEFNNVGSNIRIIDRNHNPLPFYLENFNKTTKTGKLYFKIPNSIINEILIYPDTLDAPSVSDSDAIFEFFDDFNGTTIDTTKWNVINATGWSIVNGELRGSNTSGRLLSQALFSSGIILEIKSRTVSSALSGQTVGGFWSSTTDGFTLVRMNSGYRTYNYRNDTTRVFIPKTISNNVLIQFITQPTTINLKITELDTNIVAFDALRTNSVINEPIMLGRRPDNIQPNQSYVAYWDWVRVRKPTTATAMIV